MKNFAAILSILSIVVTPCLAQVAVGAVDDAACVNETAVISENQDVRNAYNDMADALRADLTADPTQFCNLSLGCTVDVGEYTSSFKITCEAEGGQLVERELIATCDGTVLIPVTDFKIAVTGAPICVGLSCDPTAIPAEIEAGVETVVQSIVEEVNANLNGTLTCEVKIAGGGSDAGEDTQMPSGGDEIGTTPSPNGGDSAPTPSTEPAPAPTSGTTPAPNPSSEPAPTPTSGAQATTIWASAVGLTVVSFIWM